MQMPGRKLSGGYRYGFNGKENDNEVKGEGNQQDYGMRIYDGRIGKFLSVDPLTKQYPELTPYQFASNSPIFAIDRDGLEMFGNNWLFDIWLEWKFGDPTGIKTLKSGLEDKATVQTRQNTYHNNVPQSIETTLDHVNNIQANLKIAAGTSKVVAFNIQTSVDVLSSVVPVEKGAMMAIESLQLSRARMTSSLVKTAKNEAFFWSGRTEGVGGAERALEIAKNKGGTTLEGLIESRGINMPTWDPNNSAAVEAWKKLSADYASQASGTVKAVIGKNLRPGNIWETAELPALKANKNVDKIITIDPKTNKQTIIFKR